MFVVQKLDTGVVEECVMNEKGTFAFVVFEDVGTVEEATDSVHNQKFAGVQVGSLSAH